MVAEQVIAAGAALRIALGEQGFATATIGEQAIVLDPERGLARLSLPVTPGPVGRFGAIRVSGAPPFSARHVGLIARFKKGDRFERSEVDDLRRALVATGLVALAEVRTVPVAGGSVIDLDVRLDARAGADDRGRAWLWHRRGRARRSELAASQLLQSRGRGDAARGGGNAGAARRGVVPPQQFPAPRPGAQRAGADQPRRPRGVRGAHGVAVGRDRAAEQFHLAEEMDVEPRRRTDRDDGARHDRGDGHRARADLLHRRGAGEPGL